MRTPVIRSGAPALGNTPDYFEHYSAIALCMKWLVLLAPVQELLLKQLSQFGLVENLVRKEDLFFSYSTFWRFLHIPSMWAWTLDQTKKMIKEADWFEQYLASVVCIAHSCPAAFTQTAEPSWPCGKFGRAPLFGSHHDTNSSIFYQILG